MSARENEKLDNRCHQGQKERHKLLSGGFQMTSYRHLEVAQWYVGRDAVNLCCIVLTADTMSSWLHGGR